MHQFCIIYFVVIFDLLKLFNMHVYCSSTKWCSCNSATFCFGSRYYFLCYVFKCAWVKLVNEFIITTLSLWRLLVASGATHWRGARRIMMMMMMTLPLGKNGWVSWCQENSYRCFSEWLEKAGRTSSQLLVGHYEERPIIPQPQCGRCHQAGTEQTTLEVIGNNQSYTLNCVSLHFTRQQLSISEHIALRPLKIFLYPI